LSYIKIIMKRFFQVLGLVVLGLVVLTAGLGAAVWFGWLRVPGPVLSVVASVKGLNSEQTRTLERAARVWQVVRSRPEGPLVERAIRLATGPRDEKAWTNLAAEAWPQITPQTLEEIRQALDVDPAQWAKVTQVVGDQVAQAAQKGKFSLTADQAAVLNKFAADTGLLELSKALSP